MKKILFAIMLVCISFNTTRAQTYYGYIGDPMNLYCTKCYAPAVCNWSTSDYASVRVWYVPASGQATITILRYFPGTVLVTANYMEWTYGLGGKKIPDAGVQYFYIRCNQVNISLTEQSLEMNPGDSHKLNYFVSSGVGATVSWSSSNDNIASVEDGVVTAKSAGTVTIVAGTNYNTRSTCTVKVNKIDPTKITLPTTGSAVLDGSGYKITPTYEPANASSDLTWESSNPNVATVDKDGYVTPVSSGTATITATTENDLTSSTTVTVSEPPFTASAMSPVDYSTNISAFTSPSVSYSLDLQQGSAFNDIKMKVNNEEVAGNVSLSGNKVIFSPDHPLMENSDYTLTIPANAIKNKWGTGVPEAVTQHFRTGPYEKLNLSASIHGGFVKSGQQVKLTTDFESTEIRYTTDGTEPTLDSQRYSGTIALYQDTRLRAKAFKEGYTPSDLVSEDFIMSDMDVKKMFPMNERIYVYKHISPFIVYSGEITQGGNIGNIRLLKNDTKNVDREIIVHDNTIYCVPKETFDAGCSYSVIIPEDAVRNNKGEPNAATEWSFTTGNIVTKVSAGNDFFASRKADGSLWTWGKILQNADNDTGDYSYEQKNEPMSFAIDIEDVSTGLTHNSMLTPDNKLYMWGRQYQGEFGNNTDNASASPIEVMTGVNSVSAGGQTTAILKNGTLYLCGRNDYGQIGDNSVEAKAAPVHIMDGVKKCIAGYASTYAIKADGSLWAWGRNEHGELGDGTKIEHHEPVLVMTEVADVAASRIGGYGAAALKQDGSLWVLGENNVQILSEVKTMSVGSNFMAAVKRDGSLWTWGMNNVGQLGTGSYDDSDVPIKIMEEVDSIDCGYLCAIALKQDGSVYTWGKTARGVNIRPERQMEGMAHSTLQGLTGYDGDITLKMGDKTVIQPMPDPINAEYSTWEWKSSNTKVATVSDNGVVEAKTNGITTLTLTVDKGAATAVCRVQVGDILYGDANGDGMVNVNDYVITVNDITRKNPSGFNSANADVNQDGVVNVNDLVSIVNIIVRKN